LPRPLRLISAYKQFLQRGLAMTDRVTARHEAVSLLVHPGLSIYRRIYRQIATVAGAPSQ